MSDGFLAGNLTNGVSRCFAVSAVTRDGHESDWSDSRLDTPRYDARNAFVYSTARRARQLGIPVLRRRQRRMSASSAASSRTDLDFTVERHADGSLWFAPARTGVTMTLYSTKPVADLTSIDRAPATGFASVTIEALPGYAYVFRVAEGRRRSLRGDSRRVRHDDYVVFDWAYQSAPGNAELSRAARSDVDVSCR